MITPLAAVLPWTAHLDREDLAGLLVDINLATNTPDLDMALAKLTDCLIAWQASAEALADPLRRSVLTGPLKPGDLVDAPRPEDVDGEASP